MKSSNTPAFENPFGHFARDGYEFVITTPETPRPWSNIISNGDFGLAVSQAGGGFSWRTHVSMNRLTRWNQDMIRDDWGKWLYLRDLDSGAFRSLAYQPVQAEYDLYEARHGLGYTTFVQKFGDMESEWTLFAAMGDPVEIWLVTLRNNGTQRRRFQLASYLEWNLGAAPDNHREFHKLFIDTAFDAKRSALVATKLLWEVPTERGHWNTDWPYIAFHAASEPLSGWDTSKDQLIGRHGGFHNPRGLREGEFAGQTGRYEDAVASLATDIELAPGEEKTVVFLLGQPDKISRENLVGQAASLIDVYRNVERAREALQEVTDYWKNLCSLVHLETPDPAFNLLNNVWLKYQAISGHLWGRTGYYQQSGAFGFRDQMQASQVWLPLDPPKMLEQARLNARHQFEDGKVLHWWHPLTETGLPTDMVDDLLWLPYMLTRYFNETRNFGALLEEIPYYDQGAGSLQEHCVRAIEVVLERFSERGIPLMGAGDWCDGFSAVGLDWKGESVWLGMFLYDILVKWADILTTDSPEADVKTAARFRERARNLKDALNEHAWNGEWYICATKDDGALMGDPSLEENKIYLNSQTWAIITGVADDNRRNKVAQAVLDHLEGDNGTTLFRPAYHTPDKNIGYITRYAPGLRENGGVYTHAATWSVMAFAEMGRGEDAFRLFQKLNPILQAQKDAHRYYAEPFVLPGNIDGFDSPNYGRAGWTWYTGSAGWLFTIAHENIVGVRSSKDGLIVDPCIPREWPSFTAKRRFRDGVYHILVENPNGISRGVKKITVNGTEIPGNVIPPLGPGEHRVRVILEGDV